MKLKTWQIVLLVIFLPTIFVVWNLMNKPAALVNKATDTTKMLQNYEWFYEASNNFSTRTAQIATIKRFMDEETDRGELSRLRVDVSAIQQSCRELAAKYAAQSGKIHVGYLKSKDLPETLNQKECE